MSTLERQTDTATVFHHAAGGDDPGSTDMLAAVRAEAGNLAAAGRTAIHRALSENSAEFLRAARQQGGE